MAANTSLQTIEPKSILVVDDEPAVLDSLRLLLKIGRHQVEVADQGEKALSMYAPGKYDLVITDCAMPDLNGLELAKAIKQRVPAQPVMMITAYEEIVRKNEDWQKYVDIMLSKPFSKQELEEALAKVLQ